MNTEMTMLAGASPEVASAALQEHTQTGGSTFDPRSGASLSAIHEWAVGAMPESAWVSEKAPSVQDYSSFVQQHTDIFTSHGNSAVGTYFDPETGLHHLEIVALSPSKNAAKELANSLGEQHIYHLGRAETDLAEGNKSAVNPQMFSERFEGVNATTPKRLPFRGTHYSDQPLDAIDGSKRGASGLSSESARLRESPNAPPGYHVYVDGSLPDAPVAARKYSYPVQGSFSFASTDDPEFQDAYQANVDRGHGAAVNAAEHAVRDAGYDGYQNPKYPNSRFLFGSRAVTNGK